MPFSLTSEGRSLSNLFNSNEQNSDNILIEKQNLLSIFKLVIKDLLNSSLRNERVLEKEHFPLRHFFIVLEHILLHGYIGKKAFSISSSSNRKDLWPIIELITRKSTDQHTSEISISLKEMTNIRTSLGRVRAWLRLALMQKRLADYFKFLVEQKQELNDLYENEAILLSDDSIIITGLLVGLNVLDFNFCLKETMLDIPIESNIRYSLYLRERRLSPKNTHPPGAIEDPIDEIDDYSSLSSSPPTSIRRGSIQNDDTVVITSPNDIISLDENNIDGSYEPRVLKTSDNQRFSKIGDDQRFSKIGDDQRFSKILDQKSYLEELNRYLKETVTKLQERLQTLEQTNKNLVEDTTIQKTRIEQLEEELGKLTLEKEQMQSSYQRKIQTLNADIEVERETFKKSRTGFDLMYNELQKKYEDERTSKQKIENVYQTQLSQTNEFIESTKSMEKDIEIKTTLYDRMKEENTRLSEKLQTEQTQNNEKERQIQVLGKENQMLRQTISELETNIEQLNQEIHAIESTNGTLSLALAKANVDKTSLETDLHVEQDFHQRLQEALINEKEKVSTLQFNIHGLNIMKQEYDTYKKEMSKKVNDYETKLKEEERTIQELALKLEASFKREDEFREKDGLRSSPWMKDVTVKECCQCKKDFNALRRRHHCRSCGQIFCEACVSTKLALSGSSKPVRVCDACCTRVLAQCAVNS